MQLLIPIANEAGGYVVDVTCLGDSQASASMNHFSRIHSSDSTVTTLHCVREINSWFN
jgi:hypothetical protein